MIEELSPDVMVYCINVIKDIHVHVPVLDLTHLAPMCLMQVSI